MNAKAPRKPCSTPGCERLARPYKKLCCKCDNRAGRSCQSIKRCQQEHHLKVVAYALGLIPVWPHTRKYDLSNPADRRSWVAAMSARRGIKKRTLRKLREAADV